jgi:hypothetical protein
MSMRSRTISIAIASLLPQGVLGWLLRVELHHRTLPQYSSGLNGKEFVPSAAREGKP